MARTVVIKPWEAHQADVEAGYDLLTEFMGLVLASFFFSFIIYSFGKFDYFTSLFYGLMAYVVVRFIIYMIKEVKK